ncbi:MAG TPA: hypothetical protein VN428_20585 [Bryobacteraceae bacterium]|nr:hypothetical protein [Bryobacteraceae bacterium]
MDQLRGDDKKAAVKGVPGAFGMKDEDPRPKEGDKHSGMQKNQEPVKRREKRAAGKGSEPK